MELVRSALGASSAPLSPRDYLVPSVGDQSPHCTFSPSLAGEAKFLDRGVGGLLVYHLNPVTDEFNKCLWCESFPVFLGPYSTLKLLFRSNSNINSKLYTNHLYS